MPMIKTKENTYVETSSALDLMGNSYGQNALYYAPGAQLLDPIFCILYFEKENNNNNNNMYSVDIIKNDKNNKYAFSIIIFKNNFYKIKVKLNK